VNRQQWVKYVNRHIPPESDLPRLTEEELERWKRLGLLVPAEKQPPRSRENSGLANVGASRGRRA